MFWLSLLIIDINIKNIHLNRLQNISEIEKYFKNDLNQSQLREFNLKLECDDSFRRQVNQYEQVFGSPISQRNQANNSHRKTKIIFNYKFARILMVFSGCLLFVLLHNRYIVNFNGPSSEDLFSEYFYPYPNIAYPLTRSATSDNNLTVISAFHDYEMGRYDIAIDKFNTFEPDQISDLVIFYKSMAQMSNGDIHQAVKSLTDMTNLSVFECQKKWYLALAYVSLHEYQKAIILLESLIQDQYNTAITEQLLQTIKKEHY